jgi:hypothetical protein
MAAINCRKASISWTSVKKEKKQAFLWSENWTDISTNTSTLIYPYVSAYSDPAGVIHFKGTLIRTVLVTGIF